ncbi:MAG: glycosyltransferase [Planctomycetes bacterium]|nr:glycosyltransferase [Planctomycetota bacterium]
MRLRDTKGPWTQAFVARRPDRRGGLRGGLDRIRMLWRWRRTPLVAAKHWLPAFAQLLQAAREQFRPDAALVEMAQMAQYLPFLSGLPTVLTDHEAGCPANTQTGLGSLGDARDRRLWQLHVRRHYPSASLLQAVTPEDAATLHERTGLPVVVRPPVCALPSQPVAPGAAPPRALFLGDYSHGPNPEAARRLARELLPRLRAAVPECELWFAGLHSDRIADLQRMPGVRIVGFVPEVHTVFAQVRLLLAPVWSGAGFRMKGLSALAHGLPVVTNPLGARGLAVPTSARQVCDDLDGLVAAAAAWLRDPVAAAAAGRAAWDFACQNVSPRGVAAWQLARVRELLAPTAS